MSKSVSPKRIDSIFASSELIQELRQKSKNIESIQEFINIFLDPELSREITVASRGKDHIVVLASSPAWAAKIRYLIPLLIDNFNRDDNFAWIRNVQIKVNKYDQQSVRVPARKHSPPSSKAIAHLRHFASSIDDEALSSVLLRMAKNHNSSGT